MKKLYNDLRNFIPAFICIIIAAAFNAGMDTLSHHFSISIFAALNPDWWNPAVSWQFKGFIVTSDAWHLFKSGMLLFVFLYGALAAKAGDWTIFRFSIPKLDDTENTFMKWYHIVIVFIISWGLYILSFNLFYDIILLSKTWSWL